MHVLNHKSREVYAHAMNRIRTRDILSRVYLSYHIKITANLIETQMISF